MFCLCERRLAEGVLTVINARDVNSILTDEIEEYAVVAAAQAEADPRWLEFLGNRWQHTQTRLRTRDMTERQRRCEVTGNQKNTIPKLRFRCFVNEQRRGILICS